MCGVHRVLLVVYLTHEHRSGPPNTLVVTLLAARGLDGKDTWCVTHVAATRLKCARWLTAVAVLRAVTRLCVSSAAARRSKAAPRRTRWTRFGTRRLPCRALTGALGWRVAPDGTGHLTRAVRSRCSNQTVKLTLSDQDFMRSKFMGQACFAPTDFVSPGLVRLCEAAVPCAVDTPRSPPCVAPAFACSAPPVADAGEQGRHARPQSRRAGGARAVGVRGEHVQEDQAPRVGAGRHHVVGRGQG